ncbi:hypothetical protein [Crenobacter cavernae]|uniref:hypothetical protein n=1 Tax=Crenobacter cavernae TaxID=2290923 RepID=UPI0011C07004|nr:hypothetical protein [Crenobacter cavernae]
MAAAQTYGLAVQIVALQVGDGLAVPQRPQSMPGAVFIEVLEHHVAWLDGHLQQRRMLAFRCVTSQLLCYCFTQNRHFLVGQFPIFGGVMSSDMGAECLHGKGVLGSLSRSIIEFEKCQIR